jgi:hypothetical protein
MTDREANRFSARAARYARVGANMSGVAARIAGARLFGLTLDRGQNALELATALGGLKGPIMKVPSHATIPTPAAGVRQRADEAAERGAADGYLRGAWALSSDRTGGPKFATFEHHPPRRLRSGRPRPRTRRAARHGCSTPTCSRQSKRTCSSCGSFCHPPAHDPVIDTTEIAGDRRRIREELDYRREANVAL